MDISENKVGTIRHRPRWYGIIVFSILLLVSMLVILVFFKDHVANEQSKMEKSVVDSLTESISILYEGRSSYKLNKAIRSHFNFDSLAKVAIYDSSYDLVSSQRNESRQLTGFYKLAFLYSGSETKTYRSVFYSNNGEEESTYSDGADRSVKSGDIIIEFYQYGIYAQYFFLFAVFFSIWLVSVSLVTFFSLKQSINLDNFLRSLLSSTGRVQKSNSGFYLNSMDQVFNYDVILQAIDLTSHLKNESAQKANRKLSALEDEKNMLSRQLRDAIESYYTYRQYIIFTTSDMRNYISSMMIDIDGMLSVQLNEYQEARCKRIKGSLSILKGLISDLMDFASDSRNRVSVFGDPVDIYHLADKAIGYVKPNLGKDIRVYPVYDLSSCNYAYLNKKFMHSIFSNVLVSSARLLRCGQIEFNVSMEENDKEKYFFTIAITGRGKMSGEERMIPSGLDHLIKSMKGSVEKSTFDDYFLLKIRFEISSYKVHSQQQIKSIELAKKHVLKIAAFDSNPVVLDSIRSIFSVIGVVVDTYSDTSLINDSYDILIGHDLHGKKIDGDLLGRVTRCIVSMQDVFDESLSDNDGGPIGLFIDSSQSIYEVFDKLVRYNAFLSLDRIGGSGKLKLTGISNPLAGMLDPSSGLVLDGYNILLIGSNLYDRSAICDQLKILGASVINCDGISQAATHISNARMDLVISDIDLEDGTAIEIFDILNDNPVNKRVPVIGLLSTDHADSQMILSAGFLTVFNKPFDDMDQLINLVVRRVKKRPQLVSV